MKWSLRLGSAFGADVRLHVSLLILIPYAFFAFRPQSSADFLRVMLLIVAIFACVALHEVGHTGAAWMLGYRATSIVLWPLGGLTTFDRRPERTLPDLIITAAGPLTNLLIFAYLTVVAVALYFVDAARLFPELSVWLARQDALRVLVGLAVANLSLAVFNLIPVYPLDGGHIARSLLKLVFGEQRADLITLVISLPAAALLVFLGLIARDVLVILTGLLLALAAVSLSMRMLNGLQMGLLYLFDRPGYHLRRYDFDPAVAAYTQMIARSPNRSALYSARAVVYFYLEQLADADGDVQRALALDPKNYMAVLLRGELLMLRGRPDLALDCFNRAVAMQPQASIGYLDRGSYYLAQGDLATALRDMDKGVELGRGLPVGFVLRSIARYAAGDQAGARSDAVAAQRYAPQWMLVFSAVFKSTLAGQLHWAQAYYALALERFPGAYQVYQGRGDAFVANGRPDLAAADYGRAISLSPRNAELYLRRGQAHALGGMRGAAAADFRQAAGLAKFSHIRRQAQAALLVLDRPAVIPDFPAAAAASVPAANAAPQLSDDPPAAGRAPAP